MHLDSQFQLVLATLFSCILSLCTAAAPAVSLISNIQLDSKGIFFVSYDGVVNVNSFQLSAVLTNSNFQYAAWYTSSRIAVLARRQLPTGDWSTLQLPHTLSMNDSHNVIVLGVSPEDGKIHVAMDCHSSSMFYTSSEAGLATSGASWVASRFGAISHTLGGLNIGRYVLNIQLT
jgi:BNR repeat-containing family member